MSDTDYIKSIEDDNEKLRANIAQLEEELRPLRAKEEFERKNKEKLAEKWKVNANYADQVTKDLVGVQPMNSSAYRDIVKAFMDAQNKQK